jgi:hypothetical protein
MEQSILKSTKKYVGLDPENTAFDLDILTLINSAFSTIHDLGVGPDSGFAIEDEETVWQDFLDEDPVQLGHIKIVVWTRTRLGFDPPTQQFLIEAINKQREEAEWRLNTNREAVAWVDPDPADVVDEDELVVLDGGDAEDSP